MIKMKKINYIIIRIKNNTKVIFEDEFIDNNQFRTQNQIIEVLSLLFDRKDFDVELYTKEFKEEV